MVPFQPPTTQSTPFISPTPTLYTEPCTLTASGDQSSNTLMLLTVSKPDSPKLPPVVADDSVTGSSNQKESLELPLGPSAAIICGASLSTWTQVESDPPQAVPVSRTLILNLTFCSSWFISCVSVPEFQVSEPSYWPEGISVVSPVTAAADQVVSPSSLYSARSHTGLFSSSSTE